VELALLEGHHAGDDIDEGALARAIVADQSDDLAG
jgi:hypothetical protein